MFISDNIQGYRGPGLNAFKYGGFSRNYSLNKGFANSCIFMSCII